MRRVRYQVAMSLDGYIAGPTGELDWITMDPEIDFGAFFRQFDTLLMGRRTYETLLHEGRGSMPDMKTVVLSRTLRPDDNPGVTVVADGQRKFVADLKAAPGKDVWLFGGGTLFRSLAEDELVDTVEIAVIPILLGSGVPLMAQAEKRIQLSLTAHKVYKTGIVMLEYRIG